jgi:hypothetical protein
MGQRSVSGTALGSESKEVAHKIMWNQHSRKRQAMQYRIIASEACESMAAQMEEVSKIHMSTRITMVVIISCSYYVAFISNSFSMVSIIRFSLRLLQAHPDRFTYHPTTWGKFPDGTDSIEVGGFTPHNLIAGEHVLFLASFENNDVTLSQFQVIICLLQSFIESLTVVLPYYPVGTFYLFLGLLFVCALVNRMSSHGFFTSYCRYFLGAGTMERVTKEGVVATAATYAHMFSSLPNCGKPTRLMVYDLHTLQNRFYLVRKS